MAWIPVVTKVYKFLASTGRNVDIDEVRKWFQPLVPSLAGKVDNILSLSSVKELAENAFPEGSWQPAVAFAQTLMLLDPSQPPEEIEERVRILLRVWNENPVNYSSLLSELRKRVIALGSPDRSIIETLTFDPSKPSYFSPENSSSGVDFFLNYLRFEEGVDVDALVDAVKKVVGKDEVVEEVLRLSGIDLLISPTEFVERVGKVVDVLLKAKEQGLDVEKIVEEWDREANQGGDRFSYLEVAVKEVAAREVAEAFWREMERVLGEKGIKVTGKDGRGLPMDLFYLDLVNIEGTKVDLSPMEELLNDLTLFLKKVRPIAFYTAEEMERVLRELLGVGKVSSPEAVKTTAKVLANLDRFSAAYLFQEGIPLHDIVKEGDPEEVAKKLSEALREAHQEGVSGKMLVEYLKKRLT